MPEAGPIHREDDVENLGPTISSNGLDGQGLSGVAKAHWNYGTAALYTAALSRGEGRLANGGALVGALAGSPSV